MKYTDLSEKSAVELAELLKEKGSFVYSKTKVKDNATN